MRLERLMQGQRTFQRGERSIVELIRLNGADVDKLRSRRLAPDLSRVAITGTPSNIISCSSRNVVLIFRV